MAAPRRIVVVNAGSSSLKLRVIGEGDDVLAAADAPPARDHDAARDVLGAFLADAPPVDAAGHRIVHGGVGRDAPAHLDADLERAIADASALAPLHDAPALTAAGALRELRPDLPAVACFDTAFHATLPPEASTYAVPAAWRRRWPLRRLGFHGLSHAWASRRAAELLGRPAEGFRVVTAHLGAGASLAAVASGRSVDTTMGFTPLEGLVMATRSGSVDPGMLLWVLRSGAMTADAAERGLEHEAGLLGLSERSADLREIEAGAREGDERCRLAIDVYVHRLAGAVASMASALRGLDALAFTGGIGEGSALVRARTVERLAFLGLAVDPARNEAAQGDAILSAGAPAVLVVTAREDLEIARQVRSVLA